ncbi:hypothetical protein LV779_08305 [Streptomyces thinghirensis]|nr:hypothetical protein [Streptomyces thinghirensis]
MATKKFYVARGLTVGKSFGRKYVEFETPPNSVKLALYGRRASPRTPESLPRAPDRTGSTIGGGDGSFTDPEGFAWRSRPRSGSTT